MKCFLENILWYLPLTSQPYLSIQPQLCSCMLQAPEVIKVPRMEQSSIKVSSVLVMPTVTAPHEHCIPALTDYHSNLIGLQYEANHKRLELPEEAEAQRRETIFSEKGPFMLSFRISQKSKLHSTLQDTHESTFYVSSFLSSPDG